MPILFFIFSVDIFPQSFSQLRAVHPLQYIEFAAHSSRYLRSFVICAEIRQIYLRQTAAGSPPAHHRAPYAEFYILHMPLHGQDDALPRSAACIVKPRTHRRYYADKPAKAQQSYN